MEPSVIIGLAGLTTFLIYHKLEPRSPATHAVLLLLVPFCISYATASQLSSLLLAATYACTAYWATISLLVVAYRLSPFHPLAKFPGPLGAKVSKLWMVYITSKGYAHETGKRLHAQYGEVVRIGPNELSVSRADAIQPILAAKLLKKGPYYDTRSMESGTALDGLREWSQHAVRRKPWMKAMSMAALKGYDVLLVEKIHELVDSLESRAKKGEVINISDWMSFFGFDFMGRMAFDHDFGMMKAGSDHEGFWHTLEKGTTVVAYLSHISWVMPILALIPNEEMQQLSKFGLRVATERVNRGSSSKDLFYYLTGEDLTDPNAQRLSFSEVTSDGVVSIIAGSDTSATALSHIWYYLLRNPNYYNRLRKEVEETFPNGEDPIDFTRQADMPFLNACINEALRLYPPVISGLQRRVDTGTGGMMIADYFVPDSTSISVHHYTTHRSPQYFSPLPDAFWPDRWITQDTYTLPSGETIGKDSVTVDRSAYIPFSVGPQGCAGRALASMELRAVVCAIVQRFAGMRVAEGFDLDSWEKNVTDIYITLRGPLNVKLDLRG